MTTFYDPMLAKIVVAGPTRTLPVSGSSRPRRQRHLRRDDESRLLPPARRLGARSPRRPSTSTPWTGDRSRALQAEALVALVVAADILAGHGAATRPSASATAGASAARLGSDDAAPSRQQRWTTRSSSTVLSADGQLGGRDDTPWRCSRRSRGCQAVARVDGVEGLFHFARDPDGVTIGYRGASYRFELVEAIGGPRPRRGRRRPRPGPDARGRAADGA